MTNNATKLKYPPFGEPDYAKYPKLRSSEDAEPNRVERRKAHSLRKRMRLPRPQGTGYGKHAMNGNKYRFVHVNWTQRICNEMKQSKRVKDYLDAQKV